MNKQYGLILSFAIMSVLVGSALTTGPSRAQVRSGETGLSFEGQATTNQARLQAIEYTGECPGREEPSGLTAWFISGSTPPGPQRRVVITNVTTGLDPNHLPYTDRAYDGRSASESISIEFGTRHSNRVFRVQPGRNTFEYQIREGNRDIEDGTFIATFDLETRSQVRNSCRETREVCAVSSVSLDRCADIRTQEQWKCPNGSVIHDETFPSGPPRTIIRNETSDWVYFELNNGRQMSLPPGQEFELTGNSPGSIRYGDSEQNPDNLNRTSFLQPAVLYRFYRTGGTLNLRDR
jgi:hypothetical protein